MSSCLGFPCQRSSIQTREGSLNRGSFKNFLIFYRYAKPEQPHIIHNLMVWWSNLTAHCYRCYPLQCRSPMGLGRPLASTLLCLQLQCSCKHSFFLMFGCQARLPVDLSFQFPNKQPILHNDNVIKLQ